MKKMMYNEPYGLQEAVLNGSKTMTRRDELSDAVEIIGWFIEGLNDEEHPNTVLYKDKYGKRKLHKCKYEFGEVIAIAQPYKVAINELDWANRIIYEDSAGWNNKMFVKADMMPHQQKVTDIKIERLQDISDEDCLKEGIAYDDTPDDFRNFHLSRYSYQTIWGSQGFGTAREAFATLINAVSGKGYWESNPFVVVYETELIK